MKVYLLSHSREIEPDVVSLIIIGIYSSVSMIDAVKTKYKNKEGFKDYPNDFVYKEYEVVFDDSEEIIYSQSVYLLQHEYSIVENDIIYDYITDIDIFSTYNGARKREKQLIKEKLFPLAPDGLYAPYGFCVSKYILDEDDWVEGFVSN